MSFNRVIIEVKFFPPEWFDFDRSEEMAEGRRPWIVCAVWWDHPKRGRSFMVGTELLPDLPITHVRLHEAAKKAMTFGEEPPPDEVYFQYTSIYD